jgi:hypothetical protein
MGEASGPVLSSILWKGSKTSLRQIFVTSTVKKRHVTLLALKSYFLLIGALPLLLNLGLAGCGCRCSPQPQPQPQLPQPNRNRRNLIATAAT